MKQRLAFALLAVGSLSLFACSSSDDTGGSSGSSGNGSSGNGSSGDGSSGSSGNGSSGSSGNGSSETTCTSSSLNGQCLKGPNKGASCCYQPSSEDDPPCSASNDCDSVCKTCE